MAYENLIDFIADIRGAEVLTVPPGGATRSRTADAYLCSIAEQARVERDPVSYLRMKAAAFNSMDNTMPWYDEIMVRLASWAREFEARNEQISA